METPSKIKTRSSNFELLKIVSMFFVLSLHTCTQSGIADAPVSISDGILFIFLSEFGRTSCSVFIMISAWFLSDLPFKLERFMIIWLKTLAYIFIVYFLVYHSYELPWYNFFPMGGGILWFMSAYMCMLLISPLLNFSLRYCSKEYVGAVILLIGIPLLFYSTVSLTDGPLGNNVIWFSWLYLLMGYLRKYPVHLFENKKMMIIIFLIVCFLRIFPRIEVRWSGQYPFLDTTIPYLNWWRDVLWTIPSFISALSLFFIFAGVSIKSNRIINFFGSRTLAVYVLHQMPFFYEYLWNGLFHCRDHAGTYIEIPYLLFVICTVFIISSIFDFIFDKLIFNHLLHIIRPLCLRVDSFLQERQ